VKTGARQGLPKKMSFASGATLQPRQVETVLWIDPKA